MRLSGALAAFLILGLGSARSDECDGLAVRVAEAIGAKVGRRTGPSVDIRIPEACTST